MLALRPQPEAPLPTLRLRQLPVLLRSAEAEAQVAAWEAEAEDKVVKGPALGREMEAEQLREAEEQLEPLPVELELAVVPTKRRLQRRMVTNRRLLPVRKALAWALLEAEAMLRAARLLRRLGLVPDQVLDPDPVLGRLEAVVIRRLWSFILGRERCVRIRIMLQVSRRMIWWRRPLCLKSILMSNLSPIATSCFLISGNR